MFDHICAKLNYQKSGISAVGSALALGARCREFESPISDHAAASDMMLAVVFCKGHRVVIFLHLFL